MRSVEVYDFFIVIGRIRAGVQLSQVANKSTVEIEDANKTILSDYDYTYDKVKMILLAADFEEEDIVDLKWPPQTLEEWDEFFNNVNKIIDLGYPQIENLWRIASTCGLLLWTPIPQKMEGVFKLRLIDMGISRTDATKIVNELSSENDAERIEAMDKIRTHLRLYKQKAKNIEIDTSSIFKSRVFNCKNDLCFVLMPFNEKLQPIYEDHIKKVVLKCKLKCKRADDFFSISAIIDDIWENINISRIVIADLTGKNPNVFYEVGLAHALRKDVILITQNEDDVPFDLRHLRYVKYSYTPRGMAEFEGTLTKMIGNII